MTSPKWRSMRWPAAAILVAASGIARAEEPPRADPDAPPGFRQLIPRGRIASVDDPRFVVAERAEIPDEAWVLGVTIDGQARAYSLNLLNHHEVVNDRVGDRAVAAVW